MVSFKVFIDTPPHFLEILTSSVVQQFFSIALFFPGPPAAGNLTTGMSHLMRLRGLVQHLTLETPVISYGKEAQRALESQRKKSHGDCIFLHNSKFRSKTEMDRQPAISWLLCFWNNLFNFSRQEMSWKQLWKEQEGFTSHPVPRVIPGEQTVEFSHAYPTQISWKTIIPDLSEGFIAQIKIN